MCFEKLYQEMTQKRRDELLKEITSNEIISLKNFITFNLNTFVEIRKKVKFYQKKIKLALKKSFFLFTKVDVSLMYDFTNSHLFITLDIGLNSEYFLEIDCSDDKCSLVGFREGISDLFSSLFVYKFEGEENIKAINYIYKKIFSEIKEIKYFFEGLTEIERNVINGYTLNDRAYEIKYVPDMYVDNDILHFFVDYNVENDKKISFTYEIDVYKSLSKIKVLTALISSNRNYDGFDIGIRENESKLLKEIPIDGRILPAELVNAINNI